MADASNNRPTLVVASGNTDKVAELVALLGDRYEVLPRPADAPETIEDQDTLEGNAIKKAIEIAEFTGSAALADDTGLFVEAIDGRPGVYSARYAGENASYDENVDKLLAELAEVGAVESDERRAEFRTAVAVINPDGTGAVGEGSVSGTIADARRGASGFGYDPVFEPVEGEGRTFAEMSPEEKAELSHRARAIAALEEGLRRFS